MPTVGELIDKALEPSLRATKHTMDENVIMGCSYDIEKALPDLWNAEVLECVYAPGHGTPWQGDDVPLDVLLERRLKPGQRVRVIVLKEEE